MILWKVWTPTHGVVYYLPLPDRQAGDDAPDWVEEKASSKEVVVSVQLSFSF
ncbi:MAG: hypothetical protein HY314_01930 [Acidobacteria bacterium]|nr:hypothetical protein [Acidobacteriota bacterium]